MKTKTSLARGGGITMVIFDEDLNGMPIEGCLTQISFLTPKRPKADDETGRVNMIRPSI